MEIGVERQDGALIATAEGRIDGINASDFEQALRNAIGEGDGAVIVDFSGLSYISSAGLRAVLLIAKLLSQRSAKFGICALTDPIREVFEISGFDKIVAIHDSREEALRAVA